MIRLGKKRNHLCLLLLTTLTLVNTCLTNDGRTLKKFSGSTNELEIIVGTSADPEILQYHLTHWNESIDSFAVEDDTSYFGEGLQDVLFHSENNSLILTDLSRCLYDFQFVTCLKLLLVNRLDNLLDYMKENNLTQTDISLMNGIVNFKMHPSVNSYKESSRVLDLDEDIFRKMMELFRDRSLELNFLPGVAMELAAVPDGKDFVSFKARPHLKWSFWSSAEDILYEFRHQSKAGHLSSHMCKFSYPCNAEENETRGRKSKGGFKMPPMMILPQLIMWGFMPFVLANLQAMVMNAFMLNMMALNSAIFMTIRNLVFGPRGGPKIKYVNYGYRKKKKSNVPTLIVHSPAAFVKQPFHRRKRPNRHRPPVKLKPQFHHHIHHEPVQHLIHDSPSSFSDFYHSVEQNDFRNQFGDTAGDSSDYHAEETILPQDNPPITHGIQVVRGDGLLDGKSRIRIKITPEGPTMREVLHRVRTIEEKYSNRTPNNWNKLIHEVNFTHSQDDTPWIVSDDSTSHGNSDTDSHLSHDYNRESDDNVMNYNQNEFTPMLNYPKKLVRH